RRADPATSEPVLHTESVPEHLGSLSGEYAAGQASRLGSDPASMLAGMTEPDCVFCKILAGEIPGMVVAEAERAVAIMDISPATRGHVLVLPRAHTPDLLAAPEPDLVAVAQLTQQMARRVKDKLAAD